MKLAVVGSVGVPASYGGFETLVEHLIELKNVEFTVYCSGKHYHERLGSYKHARLVYLPLSANGIMSIPYDIISILHGIATGHRNLLVLGTSGAIVIPLISFFLPQIRIITNIDGIEWQRSKWRGIAKWFLRISESMAVRYSTKVIADNQAIAEHVSNRYKRDCETIAYGGDHALEEFPGEKKQAKIDVKRKYALALGRIEPENNTHLILKAFASVGQELVFIGNWHASEYGKDLLSRYDNYSNLTLLEPIYDVKTLYIYRKNCSLYIHGHSAGGTNPSLVEMMHFAKPVIAFDCKYNRASMENMGQYFKSADHLKGLVSECDHDSDYDMKEIAERRYTWNRVRQQYAAIYN